MSKISTVYGYIEDIIQAALPTYTKIPDPYAVGGTAEALLRKAYGIGIGPGRNTEEDYGDVVTMEREFSVILVRQVTTTDNNSTARNALELALMEDHLTLVKAFQASAELDATVSVSTFDADGGIEFLAGDLPTQKYMMIVLSFITRYSENLT